MSATSPCPIVVTGARGFLGRHVVKSLQRLFHTPHASTTSLVCPRCVRRFASPVELETHASEGACQVWQDPIVPPSPTSQAAVASFRDWSKALVLPFVVYVSLSTVADVDGVLHPTVAAAVCVSRVDSVPTRTVHCEGASCLTALVAKLDAWAKSASFHLQRFRRLQMSATDEAAFGRATHCCFCQTHLLASNKVRHHCHVTGAYLGAACRGCNVNGKTKYSLPIFCHDAKLLHPLLLPVLGGRVKAAIPRDGSYMRVVAKGHTVTINGADCRDSLDLDFKDSSLFLAATRREMVWRATSRLPSSWGGAWGGLNYRLAPSLVVEHP